MTWWDNFWRFADQSPALAGIVGTVIGGLILAAILAALAFVWSRLRRISFRQAVAGAWSWLRGLDRLRPVTYGRLGREVRDAKDAGYRERDDEVAAQRESPSRPSWRLEPNGRELGDVDGAYQGFWLWNNGHPVRDVEVSGDPAFVQFRQRAIFESADRNSGQFLAMGLTERGHLEGFTLTFAWRNRFGDSGTEDVRFESDWVSQKGVETPAMTYERGKRDGLAEGHALGFETGRQDMQAEIDRHRVRPVRKARWVVGPQADDWNQWTLANTSDGAVATEVTLDAPNYFSFLSSADWDDMTGVSHQGFRGFNRDESFVIFTVEWNDVNGQRQTEQVRYDPGA